MGAGGGRGGGGAGGAGHVLSFSSLSFGMPLSFTDLLSSCLSHAPRRLVCIFFTLIWFPFIFVVIYGVYRIPAGFMQTLVNGVAFECVDLKLFALVRHK